MDTLNHADRLAIIGPPRSGKTTLAKLLERTRCDPFVIHTDDLIDKMEWSSLSTHVVEECAGRARFLVEGVRVVHALRKGLEVDLVVEMRDPLVPLSEGQRRMQLAGYTVRDDWLTTMPVEDIPPLITMTGQPRETGRRAK